MKPYSEGEQGSLKRTEEALEHRPFAPTGNCIFQLPTIQFQGQVVGVREGK